jgi:hypothetical protein
MKSLAVVCFIVVAGQLSTALAEGLSDDKKTELALAAGKAFADEQLKQAIDAADRSERNLKLVRHGVVNPKMISKGGTSLKDLDEPDAAPPGAAQKSPGIVYFKSDSERSQAIKEWSAKVVAAKKRVADLKAGGIFDCPFFGRPPLQVGSLGRLRSQAVIVKQVLNAKEALVALPSEVLSSTINPNGRGGNVVETGEGDPFLLRGVSTAGWSDGKEVPMRQPVIISGTYSYTAASGAKRTVLLAEPLDWDAIKRERVKNK